MLDYQHSRNQSAESNTYPLCAAIIGTNLGNKIVADAKTTLAERSQEGSMSTELETALDQIPKSYAEVLATDSNSLKDM